MPPKIAFVSRIRWLMLAVALPGALSAADLQIEHVTIVSPERVSPMRDALVRVHDGRIVAIARARDTTAQSSRDTISMDGSGLFLAPGLIDSHVHLGQIPGMTPDQEVQHPDIAKAARDQIPRSYLLYGFTTLIDLISTPQEMALWKNHEIVPDTYFCGGAALMDGYAMNYAPKPQRYQWWPYMLIEPGTQAPDGIDPARHTPQAVVTRMKADGAICVKTFFERGFGGVRDLPVPKLETIREVVKLAHAAGMPVLMHANSDEAQRFGLDAGVDIMAHGLWNWSQEHSTTSEVTPGIIESATYDPAGTFSNACHVAMVEVDIETGGVTIERFVVAEDAGRLINPMIVDGQIQGGVAQGIANALLEEIVYDDTGNILTATLADYLPPTAREIPSVEIHHLETLTDASITKAKGLGEGGAIGPPAAVVNAINDALSPFGVSIDEFPATPQRIRAALRAAGAFSGKVEAGFPSESAKNV